MPLNAIKPMSHLIWSVGVICLLGAILASPALGAAYLKVGDIKGESTDQKDHKDWIDILSYHKSVSNPVSSLVGGGGSSAGRADRSDFVASKVLDKSSPKLALACCNGQNIPEAILEVTLGGDPQPLLLYRVTMKQVRVSSYSVSGDGDTVPVDEISLNYEEVEWSYFEYDDNGRLVAEHSTIWNFRTNSGGSVSGGGFGLSPQ